MTPREDPSLLRRARHGGPARRALNGPAVDYSMTDSHRAHEYENDPRRGLALIGLRSLGCASRYRAPPPIDALAGALFFFHSSNQRPLRRESVSKIGGRARDVRCRLGITGEWMVESEI